MKNLNNKRDNKNSQKILFLDGLHCADCAEKINKEILKLTEVKESRVDFLQQKVYLVANEASSSVQMLQKAVKIINKIEPEVKVSFDKDIVKTDSKSKFTRFIPLFGGLLFALSFIFEIPKNIELCYYLLSYLLVGYSVLFGAFRNFKNAKIFDENFLMTIATVGAFIIGEYPEAVAVMIFYKIGEYFQGLAVNRSRASISSLLNIKAEFANLKVDDKIKQVAPEMLNIGDIIVVKPGEKVPVDGVIVKGESSFDLSILTGESLPKELKTADEVLSGSINLSNSLEIKVTKEFVDSAVSKILELIENASSKKSNTENFITKFAKIYTPIIVVFAALLAILPPLFLESATFEDWIYRALVFLVISCPCALVISIPLSYFGGVAAASRAGILVKGSSYLEALNEIKIVVFDKTGTLTKGKFKVEKIYAFNNFKEEDILFFAAHAERDSTHPIALSIVNFYSKALDEEKIFSHENLAGFGVKSEVARKVVLAGNEKLMQDSKIDYQKIDDVGTLVYVAIDNIFAGVIVVADEIKEDSKQAILALKRNGVEEVVMLTGDNFGTANKIATTLGVDEFKSSLLPYEKVQALEDIFKKYEDKKIAFVGDGINDAPSLARADIGFAMGRFGSDIAIATADIVLVNDEPSKVAKSIQIAKRTRAIAMQNIIFALGVKIILLIFGAFGIATMWEAVFGDVGVTLIAVLNATRALKVK